MIFQNQQSIKRLHQKCSISFKLYMLIYEEPMYIVTADVADPPSFYEEYKMILIGGGVGLLAVVLGSVFYVRRKKGSLGS